MIRQRKHLVGLKFRRTLNGKELNCNLGNSKWKTMKSFLRENSDVRTISLAKINNLYLIAL